MFISSLDLTGEVEVDALEGQGEFLVRIAIGFDPDRGTVYSLVVALSPLAGYVDVPGYELIFNIVEAAVDGSVFTPFWDGLATKPFLVEAGLRRRVRSLVCLAAQCLIDAANPKIVSMSTHTANLPDAALAKYHEICAVFRANGFMAGKADSWYGQFMWMMER